MERLKNWSGLAVCAFIYAAMLTDCVSQSIEEKRIRETITVVDCSGSEQCVGRQDFRSLTIADYEALDDEAFERQE